MDKFKDIIKNKILFKDSESHNNATLWEQLETQIDRLEGRKRQTKRVYTYAAAASVVLGIMIALLITPARENSLTVVRKDHDISFKDTVLRPTIKPALAEDVNRAQVKPMVNTSKSLENNGYPPFQKQEGHKNLSSKEHPQYFELPDQSVVALDKATQLFYNDSYQDLREVMLEGQGYFEVVHNPAHPFKVHFGNTHLVVLGTKFYIKGLPSDSAYSVAVVEGRVKVYNPLDRQYTVLTKGQELVLTLKGKSALSSQIPESTVLWKAGALMFDKARLKNVFYALNKEHHANIKYDAKISECIFTGNLSGMSLSDALNLIKMTTNLVAEENNGQIFVTGTKCN